ncbi:MAG TPA: ATP-binding protein, partial [Geodermatophilus sp.]|nr:ATP-binding protein [Geodermatophilus sp.]
AARRRAVAETDSERRRIERDLHDGAQHHLVSLSLALGLVEHELATGRLEHARTGLERIGQQIDTVEELLARTATGVTSPVLAERGLVAALHEEFDSGDPTLALDTSGAEGVRFPAEVEAALYFCCLEAVNNARKHAAGAAVRLRLAVDGDRLRFAVHDDGPGGAPSSASASLGRGMQNVSARIAAVGGQVDVRSAPGAGTTVEGSVPLPDAAPGRPATGPRPAPGLLDQVRIAVRAARDLYHGTPQAEPLRALARCLDEPLRVAVTGPSPAATEALVEALSVGPPEAPSSTCPVRYLCTGGPGDDGQMVPAPDAYVVLLECSGRDDDDFYAGLLGILRPAQTIGVLLDAGGSRDDDGPGSAVRRLCQAVVPAPAAAASPPHAGRSAGAMPHEGAAARVRELVDARLVARVEALKARTALAALDTLLRAAPPGGNSRRLLYQLDEIRSGAHQLAELDLLDALCSGELRVPDDERLAAERLLGMVGMQAAARLGCSPDAGAAVLADTAREQLARWQRAAAHPASTAATRTLAHLMVRTCERLLADVAASG